MKIVLLKIESRFLDLLISYSSATGQGEKHRINEYMA